jgi:hypothetical protein
MSNLVRVPRKLIEVALPLNAINAAAVRKQVHSTGAPQYAASVVGSKAASSGAGGNLMLLDYSHDFGT